MSVRHALARTGPAVAACAALGSIGTREVNSLCYRLGWAIPTAAVLAASSADLVRRTAAVDTRAGAARAPYARWCTFATALSAALWSKNRGRRP